MDQLFLLSAGSKLKMESSSFSYFDENTTEEYSDLGIFNQFPINSVWSVLFQIHG